MMRRAARSGAREQGRRPGPAIVGAGIDLRWRQPHASGGGWRGDAASVRDWVLRFNAHGPGGLIDRTAPGHPSRLNDGQRAALAAMVENGPIPAVHGVIRWQIIDLCQWIWEEYQISVSKQTLSRELRAIGYRKLSARPRHHAQKAGAVEAFKKSGPPHWRRSRASGASMPAI